MEKRLTKEAYSTIITRISSLYDNVGYPRLWDSAASLKDSVGEKQYELIQKIVDNFLGERNSNGNTRIFGKFSDEQISSLAEKCLEIQDREFY